MRNSDEFFELIPCARKMRAEHLLRKGHVPYPKNRQVMTCVYEKVSSTDVYHTVLPVQNASHGMSDISQVYATSIMNLSKNGNTVNAVQELNRYNLISGNNIDKHMLMSGRPTTSRVNSSMRRYIDYTDRILNKHNKNYSLYFPANNNQNNPFNWPEQKWANDRKAHIHWKDNKSKNTNKYNINILHNGETNSGTGTKTSFTNPGILEGLCKR